MRKFIFGVSKRPLLEDPGWTYTPQIDLTNGGADDQTSFTLTQSVPEVATAIEVLLDRAATNTSAQEPVLRIGPSSGVVSTGYTNFNNVLTTSGVGGEAETDGFHFARGSNYSANEELTGKIVLTKWDPSENIWHAHGVIHGSGSNNFLITGYITLGGPLTDIGLDTIGGAALYNNGEARVRYRR